MLHVRSFVETDKYLNVFISMKKCSHAHKISFSYIYPKTVNVYIYTPFIGNPTVRESMGTLVQPHHVEARKPIIG